MVEKPYVSAFQNFFRIENPLNIKEVISKNVSDNNNAAMLLKSKSNTVQSNVTHVRDVKDFSMLYSLWSFIEIFHIFDISDMNTVYKATLSKVSKVLYT